MRIINLIENTEGTCGCAAEHGLSFYVETKKHKLLLDLGPSKESLGNAEKLGIDMTAVDTVILSHGHYDHSGGILPFAELNSRAVIYMQETALKAYYADEGPHAEGGRFRYIGIDPKIRDLPQVRFLRGNQTIDEEVCLFQISSRTRALPFTNRSLLVKTDDSFIRDEFDHEQYLVLSAEGKHILLSGCAHNGILNVMDTVVRKFGIGR